MPGLFDDSASGDYYPDFPVDDNAGDSPASGGTLPGTSGSGGWLDTLAGLGGKAIDAYGKYSTLQAQKSAVDVARTNAAAASDRARAQAKLQTDLLGFSGAAERTRAAQSALQAQQGYQAAALVGSPIVLVAIGVGLFFLAKR